MAFLENALFVNVILSYEFVLTLLIEVILC